MISVIYEHERDKGPAPVRVMWRVVASAWVALVAAGCASVPGSVARPSPFPGSPTSTPRAILMVPPVVVDAALSLRGTPYRLGGEEPGTGLDCSGLVRHVFSLAGIDVPRTVIEQFEIGESVRRPELRRGDLIFFDTSRPGPSHVGIAIDADTFVHAPGSGGVVRVDSLEAPYWKERLRGIRRVGRPGVVHRLAAPSAGTSM